jgi:peroxiredoxin
VVPSCVRIGNKVEDFALYDLDGNVWELSKKRGRAKLVLLEFWATSCTHCLGALRFVGQLDEHYRQHGLAVVGIAHEEGTFSMKQSAVRGARARYGIGYPLLLTGGGTSSCPVIHQLAVHDLPTLILLDESGKIVWRARGVNDYSKQFLKQEIERRLGLRR